MTPDELAQERELAEWEQNQRNAIMTLPVEPSAEFCTDPACGDEIPKARRTAIPGVQFCAECQTRREHKNIMMRR